MVSPWQARRPRRASDSENPMINTANTEQRVTIWERKQWETIIRNWLKSLFVEKMKTSRIFQDLFLHDNNRLFTAFLFWANINEKASAKPLVCAGIHFFCNSTSMFNNWFPIQNRGLSTVYENESLFILGTYNNHLSLPLCTFTEMLPGHQISKEMKLESF